MSAFNGTCCAAVDDIGKACAEHALGVSTTVEIIEACDLTSIPAATADTHTIATDAVVDTGKRWYQWKIGGTPEFTSVAQGTAGNQTFLNTLTVFLPLLRDEVDFLLNAMLNGEFVIRFGDIGGRKRLLGTEHSPAMIAEGGVNAVISNESNGVTITFTNRGKTPFYYTGAVSFTPAA